MNTITPRLRTIGLALLGEYENGKPMDMVLQHVILKEASRAELVAAKAIITRFHSDNIMAVLLVDRYLDAKFKAA